MAKEGLNVGSDVRDGFDADAFNLVLGRSHRKEKKRNKSHKRKKCLFKLHLKTSEPNRCVKYKL